MGKFSNSEIHNQYSDWHWNLVGIDNKYKRLYQCDIDRLWIEYNFDNHAIVAVIDLKREGSGDNMTSTEKAVYEWFITNGAKCYVVYINDSFTNFRVVTVNGNYEQSMSSIEYADWLLSLRKESYATVDWENISF